MGGRTEFTRVSGGIVHDSFSIVSFFTGLLAALPAGLVLLVGSAGPPTTGLASAVAVAWGLTVLVFVSRFAQVGNAGDEEGGLFSGLAGPWSGTFLAAARLLLLWAVWLLPFVGWTLLRGEPAAPAGIPGLGLATFFPRLPVLLAVWSGLGAVLSFAFVAVSVAAPGFADLFSPGLWRALFAGRAGELFVAIAGTFGPPAAVLVVLVPLLGTLASLTPKLVVSALVLFLLYTAGMVLTLQGKLCGAFVAASLVEEEPAAVPAGAPLPAEEAAAPPGAEASPERPAAEPAAAPAPPAGDPRNLHAVWRNRLAEGDAAGALDAAREAIPAGLAGNEPGLAAEVYRQHLDRLPDLDLDRAALDLLADQLLRDGDVSAAAWTFSQALDAKPSDPKAFKGLLRVAEHFLEKSKQPLEAVRIYRYLLMTAPASPFADHARDLLSVAERKAAREQGPQG